VPSAGPMVRIRLPPAASPVRTRFCSVSAAVRILSTKSAVRGARPEPISLRSTHRQILKLLNLAARRTAPSGQTVPRVQVAHQRFQGCGFGAQAGGFPLPCGGNRRRLATRTHPSATSPKAATAGFYGWFRMRQTGCSRAEGQRINHPAQPPGRALGQDVPSRAPDQPPLPAFQYSVRRRRQGWVNRSCLHTRIRNWCRQLAARNAVMPPTSLQTDISVH
jgi:hypothetical protein